MYSKTSINDLANAVRNYLATQDEAFLKPPFLTMSKSKSAIDNLNGKLIIKECLNSINKHNINNNDDSSVQTFDLKDEFSFKIIINPQSMLETVYDTVYEIAYQIGHLFIHLNYGSKLWLSGKNFTDTIISRSSINATDYEANQFASSFMMPEKETRQAFSTIKTTKQLSTHFNVPVLAIIKRGKELGLC